MGLPRAPWGSGKGDGPRWLLVRRGSEDPEDVAFYQVYGPERLSEKSR